MERKPSNGRLNQRESIPWLSSERFVTELSPSFKDDFIRLKPHDGENESDLVLSTVTDPASMAVTEKVNLLPRTSRANCLLVVSDKVYGQAQDVESAVPQLRPELTNEDPTKKNKLWARQLWAFVEVPAFVLSDQRWL